MQKSWKSLVRRECKNDYLQIYIINVIVNLLHRNVNLMYNGEIYSSYWEDWQVLSKLPMANQSKNNFYKILHTLLEGQLRYKYHLGTHCFI